MYSQLFYDGVQTLVLPMVLIKHSLMDETGFNCVFYGNDNKKFYYSFSTIITN